MILKNPILVTGAAGVIGAALTRKLLDNGEFVVGLDNINDYYEKNLKLDRLREIEKYLGNNDKNWKSYLY